MATALKNIAQIIRSKNAGPFELTLDVLFSNRKDFERAQKSGVLSAQTIAKLYQVEIEDVLSVHFFAPAWAFKATIVRKISSGTAGDFDVFGAQQHAPLLDLEIPALDHAPDKM